MINLFDVVCHHDPYVVLLFWSRWFQMVLLGVLLEPGVNGVKPNGHEGDGHSWWTAFHLHVTVTASNFHLSRSGRPDRMIGSHMIVRCFSIRSPQLTLLFYWLTSVFDTTATTGQQISLYRERAYQEIPVSETLIYLFIFLGLEYFSKNVHVYPQPVFV